MERFIFIDKFLKKLIAATVIISTAAVIMPQKADAAWINNYYGGWLEVMYNKSIYIIDPSQVEYAGSVKRYL